MPARSAVQIEGRTLNLSNLDKVLYPEAEWTKAHIIDYYTKVAPVLLPHLAGRALTLKRYPEGVESEHFYEKECPRHRPEWVRTEPVWSGYKKRDINYCVIDDLPSLVWVANLANIELHTMLSMAEDVTSPTMMAFDLDPGPPAGILECAEVALQLRSLFKSLGLDSYPKTSGSKGMQLYIPLNVPATYEDTKPLARAVAELMEKKHPDKIVSRMKKSLRPGKVLIDWSQNDEHKSTVCVYSLRARERPTVSTPVEWREVKRACDRGDPDLLRFEAHAVIERIGKKGDLFAAVLDQKQGLPPLDDVPA